MSSSSGLMLSGGSVPASPGTISSASSIEDMLNLTEELRKLRIIKSFITLCIYFIIVSECSM